MVNFQPVVESCGHVARDLKSGGLVALRRQEPVRKQNVIWAIWSVSRVIVILSFVCEVSIMRHFNNEPPCRPYHYLCSLLLWNYGCHQSCQIACDHSLPVYRHRFNKAGQLSRQLWPQPWFSPQPTKSCFFTLLPVTYIALHCSLSTVVETQRRWVIFIVL